MLFAARARATRRETNESECARHGLDNLQAAAATEAKSQFLARMSHEIRTPLNGMIAVGQLLAETSLSPAQWDLVNTVRSSGAWGFWQEFTE